MNQDVNAKNALIACFVKTYPFLDEKDICISYRPVSIFASYTIRWSNKPLGWASGSQLLSMVNIILLDISTSKSNTLKVHRDLIAAVLRN